ncbi:MAG: anti-sigma factor, partial [Acidobacteria bacterium]|nr:anti-sigma factor [Acidobacteriota bacterium]
RLSDDLENSRAAIGQMVAELDKLRNARIEDALALEDRQARVEQLQKQLSAQTQSLDRSRRLLAADRDIRELMGARDLHITDVYDVDAKGKTRQLFGRVFYTKEKSLVFYAFDLQNPQPSTASQSFQAWGYKESSKQVTRSLGIFFLDDKNQNRWALKFDNPEVLAEIDAVFVTVEPPGGSIKPTGQKLLYAFLRGDVNHP